MTSAAITATATTAGRSYRRIRQVVRVAGLAVADILAFITADFLLRWGHRVPTLALFPSSDIHHSAKQIDIFLVLAALFIVVRFFAGDYSRRRLFWDSTRLTTVALLVASLPDVLLFLLGDNKYSAVSVIGSWSFLVFAIPAFRQLARVTMSRLGLWQIPSIFVGSGERAEIIIATLSSSLSLGFDLRTIITAEEAELPASLSQLRRIQATDPQETAMRVAQTDCEQAVVATDDMQSPRFSDIVHGLLEENISVAMVPSLRRLPLVGLSTSYFFGRDILVLQVRNNLRQLSHQIIKRAFDVIGSFFLLVILLPLFVAIAIAIKCVDDGPVIYAHRRIGRNGLSFGCLKFRTMAVDADARLEQWRHDNPGLYQEFLETFKLRNDPRVTRPGKWLRRTSLDELPQLFNVLLGEMSLVGPRPVVAQELHDYYGPAAQLYCRVRPGLTGLWQVSGRSETSYEERVTLDEWYILNWTFWYDIVILLQTGWIVLSGKGAF